MELSEPNVYISSSGEISASFFRVDQYGAVTSRMLIGNDVQLIQYANLGFFGDRLLVGGTEQNLMCILVQVEKSLHLILE